MFEVVVLLVDLQLQLPSSGCRMLLFFHDYGESEATTLQFWASFIAITKVFHDECFNLLKILLEM